MKKQIIAAISTHPVRAAFLLILLFLLGSVMHQALGQATATHTPTATPTPTCSPGGSPGPWTEAAPVAMDHFGGFMDSDGTYGYEGGGYSDPTISPSSGALIRLPTAGRLLLLCPISTTPRPQACMRLTSTSSSSSAGRSLLLARWPIPPASTTSPPTSGAPERRCLMCEPSWARAIPTARSISSVDIPLAMWIRPSSRYGSTDTVTNTLRLRPARAACRSRLGGAGSGVINGHLYIAGGRDANNTGSTRLTTTTLPPIPGRRELISRGHQRAKLGGHWRPALDIRRWQSFLGFGCLAQQGLESVQPAPPGYHERPADLRPGHRQLDQRAEPEPAALVPGG